MHVHNVKPHFLCMLKDTEIIWATKSFILSNTHLVIIAQLTCKEYSIGISVY